MKKEKKRSFLLGISILLVLFCFVFSSFFYMPYDPNQMDNGNKFAGISLTHWMGCDNFGRDIYSRILQGTRTTFLVAFFTVMIGGGIGTALGAITGYFGGWLDEILMRINDAVAAFPNFLLALVVISLIGPGMSNVIMALGIVFIPGFARIARGEFLRCRNMDYVKSAKLMGAGPFRIIIFHIFPNTIPVLLSAVTIGFNNAVIAEASMSFLGIGVRPPDASLGRMLSEAQAYLFSTPSYAFFPGMVVVLLVLGFSLLGNGLERKA